VRTSIITAHFRLGGFSSQQPKNKKSTNFINVTKISAGSVLEPIEQKNRTIVHTSTLFNRVACLKCTKQRR